MNGDGRVSEDELLRFFLPSLPLPRASRAACRVSQLDQGSAHQQSDLIQADESFDAPAAGAGPPKARLGHSGPISKHTLRAPC